MDWTRFALYTALAVITYLLLLAWQEDYPPTVDSGPEGAAPATDAPAAPRTDIPSDAPAPRTDASDVPAAEAPAGAEPPAPPRDLVRVRTDTLALAIDPVGGDIVELALPRHLKRLDEPDDPFVILESGAGREYAAQSGLIGRDGIDADGRAVYRAAARRHVLADGEDSLTVELVADAGDGARVVKRFRFARGSYLIDIEFEVDNRSERDFQASVFGQVKRDGFDDPSSSGGFGRTFLGFVTTAPDDPYVKRDLDDVDDGAESIDMTGGWIGFSQHYFVSVWIPDPDAANRLFTRRGAAGQYFGGFTGEAFAVPAGRTGGAAMRFYAGPKDQYALGEIAPDLNLVIDYGFLWFLAAPIYWVLSRIDGFVGNYGVSIILLTVVVKALFYKLSETQYRSMADMRRMMPKIQRLKDNYGDDRVKLQEATMALYRKEKANPLGGCLPLLVQMPVFIALYWVLMESVELRHAPFMLWIDDLSVRDPFFVLPLLMGATMYLQTSLSPAPVDPIQARVVKLMPVGMTVVFLWFPAGLVLYWLTNAALSIAQQWYVTRKIEAAHAAKGAA